MSENIINFKVVLGKNDNQSVLQCKVKDSEKGGFFYGYIFGNKDYRIDLNDMLSEDSDDVDDYASNTGVLESGTIDDINGGFYNVLHAMIVYWNQFKNGKETLPLTDILGKIKSVKYDLDGKTISNYDGKNICYIFEDLVSYIKALERRIEHLENNKKE